MPGKTTPQRISFLLRLLLGILIGGYLLLFVQDFIFHRYLSNFERKINNEQVRIRLGAFIEYELKTLRACMDELVPAAGEQARTALLNRLQKARINIAEGLNVVEKGGSLSIVHKSIGRKKDLVERLVYQPEHLSRYREEITFLRNQLEQVDSYIAELDRLRENNFSLSPDNRHAVYSDFASYIDRMEEYAEDIYSQAVATLQKYESLKKSRERLFVIWTFVTGFVISAITITLAVQVATRIIRIQRQQKVQQQRFRTVADQSYAWEYWVKPDGSLEYISPSCERVSGYTVQEFRDNPELLFSIICTEDRDRYAEYLAVSNEAPSQLRFRIRTKNGRLRCIQHFSRPVYDEQGIFQGRRGSNIDCTEQYLAEERIRQSKQEWERTFDAIPDLIMLLDREHRIIKANQATADLLGLPVEECRGRKCYREFHNLDHPVEECPLDGLLKDSCRHEKEIYLKPLDRFFTVSIAPLHDGDGELIGFVHVARDITRMRRAEQAIQEMLDTMEAKVDERTAELRNAYNDLEQIFEVSLPLIVINRNFVIERVNKAFCRFFKVRKSHFLGHHCFDLWPGKFCAGDRCTMKRLQAGESSVTKYFDGVLPHGLSVTCSIHSAPYFDSGGNFRGQITSFFDLSERKRVEEKLAGTQRQLMHAEKLNAIGLLSASIAHEFNNPLCGILNVLERLEKKMTLEKMEREMVQLALREGERMKRLIRGLQDFNRPSSGRRSRFDLHQAMDDMVLLVKKEMKIHGIRLVKEYHPDPIEIEAIEDQVKQVLLNILKNAIEAIGDDRGTIYLGTALQDKLVRIVITDTGNLITPDDLPHIFEPFFTTKSAVSGTGLGLSVSYGIIKAHGGRIEVRSNREEGTVFTISLPLNGPLTEEQECAGKFWL